MPQTYIVVVLLYSQEKFVHKPRDSKSVKPREHQVLQLDLRMVVGEFL